MPVSAELNPLVSALRDPLGINIDVSDLEKDWSTEPAGPRYRCSACGKFVPEDDVPLLLWRKQGKEMLVLHLECALPRFVTIQRN